jgi:uncharacterized repeat protein (TIGR04138 family)
MFIVATKYNRRHPIGEYDFSTNSPMSAKKKIETENYCNDPVFNAAVRRICERDKRFVPALYFFVRHGLDYLVKKRAEESQQAAGTPHQHISGRQLLEGLREYALSEYGPAAYALLTRWGIQKSSDFGDIVFSLIAENMLGKSPNDRREDFDNGFDLELGLLEPFEPQTRTRLCVMRARLISNSSYNPELFRDVAKQSIANTFVVQMPDLAALSKLLAGADSPAVPKKPPAKKAAAGAQKAASTTKRPRRKKPNNGEVN